MNQENEQIEKQRHLFEQVFEEIEDLRDKRRTFYPLIEILFLVVSANISGYEKLPMVCLFGEEKIDWLRNFFPYKKGIPSHDTIGRVLGMIPKRQFEKAFVRWVSCYFKIAENELINIDGKRLSGSANKLDQSKKKSEGGKCSDLIVNAYASESSVVLGQCNVTDQMNEIIGAKQLLDWIEVKGCCISGDSNFCGRELIAEIVNRKADYLLTLKGKSPKLYNAVRTAFANEDVTKDNYESAARDHGRTERRVYRSISANAIDKTIKDTYKNLVQIIEVTRFRIVNRTKVSTQETHYYITSLNDTIEALAKKIRGHWSIENNLHWVLDVQFGEDASRKRVRNLASNSSIIRKIALNLLRRDKTKISLNAKKMKCAISDKYRTKILSKL
jgi:predicted transposase YbfD/YdcC